jgi:hypothetical protein
VKLTLDPNSIADYATFLRVKTLPKYRFTGRTVEFPDEYAAALGLTVDRPAHADYQPSPFLFDYQAGVSRIAITKRKFAAFVDCGLGKTLMILEFARHAMACIGAHQPCLIVSPLMVVSQTVEECRRFYGDRLPIEQVPASRLAARLTEGRGGLIITNYDALDDDTPQGTLGALLLDESSMLKSHYGKWGATCLRLGRGLAWKFACTGTPAPNDRIEYANHAVFLDAFPTVNSFLAKYFVNRGQTDNRWELKPHALDPFYRDLSHWCIFLTNPATYGWKDNTESIPPINVHIHPVDLTAEQQDLVFTSTGTLFADRIGGIESRSVLSQIAKGSHRGVAVSTNKPDHIRRLIESWPDESTIVWCKFNAEQETIAAMFPDGANITGDTPLDERQRLIADFKAGRRRVLISKPKILGFGLNLQIATRQVFSGLQDSYEEYYQAVKRSNRYGSTRPLNVHIPITEIERPMIQTVLDKAHRVQQDTIEQERIFRASSR